MLDSVSVELDCGRPGGSRPFSSSSSRTRRRRSDDLQWHPRSPTAAQQLARELGTARPEEAAPRCLISWPCPQRAHRSRRLSPFVAVCPSLAAGALACTGSIMPLAWTRQRSRAVRSPGRERATSSSSASPSSLASRSSTAHPRTRPRTRTTTCEPPTVAPSPSRPSPAAFHPLRPRHSFDRLAPSPHAQRPHGLSPPFDTPRRCTLSPSSQPSLRSPSPRLRPRAPSSRLAPTPSRRRPTSPSTSARSASSASVSARRRRTT